MQNYEVSTEMDESENHSTTEDQSTKTVETYTAAIPSSAYLGVAIGAMALSLLFQMTGRGKWGNFIAQWVPTWLIIGLYNKIVKLEGQDQFDRGDVAGEYTCEFCESKFSFQSDLKNHQKHCRERTPVTQAAL
jgi:hypothetical protein